MARLKIGQTVILHDVSGDPGSGQRVVDVAKVTAVKAAYDPGDEFNKPEHGVFLGIYIHTTALANDQSSRWGDLYVIEAGRHYDAGAGYGGQGFNPSLDYVNLNKGESAEGWLIFDVPNRHGELILTDDEHHKLATWSF